MFTIEEITLLDTYKKSNRKETIDWIKSNYFYQEDTDIIKLIDSLLFKLENISDQDFKNIDFTYSLMDEPII